MDKITPSFRYKAKVEKVIDGDTLDVLIDLGFKTFRAERVRLFGVNTPETRSADEKEKKFAYEVKLHVKGLLEGFTVIIESVKQEKYGRYLAKVYFEWGECLNDILIAKGYAKPYFGEKREKWDIT